MQPHRLPLCKAKQAAEHTAPLRLRFPAASLLMYVSCIFRAIQRGSKEDNASRKRNIRGIALFIFEIACNFLDMNVEYVLGTSLRRAGSRRHMSVRR